jgi:gas vesicle structural protein
VAVATAQNRYAGGPSPSGLADVLDLILDKGLVIDIYLRVSLVGIELLTVDARIVIASVDTYLRFAEAVGRLNIEKDEEKETLPELMQDVTSGAAKSKTSGALDAAKEKFEDMFGGDDDDEDEDDEERRERVPARRRSRRKRGDDNGRAEEEDE